MTDLSFELKACLPDFFDINLQYYEFAKNNKHTYIYSYPSKSDLS